MEELKSYCQDVINRMDRELLDIRLEYPKSDEWAQASVPCIDFYLDELKSYILQHPFKKRSEEIYFFKYVKPVVMGRMIFVCEVYNTEIFRPAHHTDEDKEYLIDEVDEIEDYFRRNDHLYEYYMQDLDTLDTKYFVRNVEDRFTKRDLAIDIDPIFFYSDRSFSTGFDYAFAKIRAMELLKDHLDNEFEASVVSGDDVPKPKLTFTGSPADFLEVVEMVKQVGLPPNPETGLPYTEEELFEKLKGGLETRFPDGIDFNTLKLISGNSDLPEKMLDALDKLHDKWDEEDRDIDYCDPDGDKPKD
ncbi:MAG: RteC domain-containing protein [Bacteroidota bacterium]